MYKQKGDEQLLKIPEIKTRLHSAPVYNLYKPNNERAMSNVFYSGGIEWNKLTAKERNLDFDAFKQLQKSILLTVFK